MPNAVAVRLAGAAIVLVLALAFAGSAQAQTCPSSLGTQTCVLSAWSDTHTDQAQPDSVLGGAADLEANESASGANRHLWLTFATGDIPPNAVVQSATVRLAATSDAPTSILLRQTSSAYQCLESSCTWRNEGTALATAAGASSGTISSGQWVDAPVTTLSYLKLGAGRDTAFRIRPAQLETPVEFASRERDPALAPQLVVTYKVLPPCRATLGATSGRPFCQPGQFSPSLMNLGLASPGVDPNSTAIAARLNSGTHSASLGEFGTRVYNGDASRDPVRKLVCTETDWGPCPLTGASVMVNPAWKPSPGSDAAMVVVDYANRRVYDLWRVDTNADGTVKTYDDGSIHVGWGDSTSLDGSGQSKGATGSGLSHLYGMVRVFEAARAVSLGGCAAEAGCALADAIPHALHFSTDNNCATTYRAPALKTDGKSTSPDCIKMGTRVYLDPGVNCAFDAGRPIEEAVCFALKRYGAFDTDSGGAPMTIGFEGPSPSTPGGSPDDPYPDGGLAWDYYDMKHIPWQSLRVAAR